MTLGRPGARRENVFKKTEENYSAMHRIAGLRRDWPGAGGNRRGMREAIRFHIEGLLEDGSRLAYVEA